MTNRVAIYNDEMMLFDDTIGMLRHLPKLVKERRTLLGLSLVDASNEIDIAHTTLRHVEEYHCSPRLKTCVLLLSWLRATHAQAMEVHKTSEGN